MTTDSWHSYPSIYALGHAAIAELLTVPVNVEEKIDGSQFSFGVFEGGIRIRSKGKAMPIDAPEKMFALAAKWVSDNVAALHYGWTYRGADCSCENGGREMNSKLQAIMSGFCKGLPYGIVIGVVVVLIWALSGCVIPGWPHIKPIPFIDFEHGSDVAVVSYDAPDVVVPPVDTNELPEVASTNAATGHEIVSIGAEEVLGSFDGSRPSVAVDSRGVPWVIVDKGTGNTLMMYGKWHDTWSEQVFCQGSKGGKYNAGRIFIPHIEVDSTDPGRAWISAKFGCKEWGSPGGQGLWCPNKFVYSRTKGERGNGNVGLMGNMGLMMCSDGRWERYDADGNRIAAGQYKLGSSGEKIRGAISGGVVHLAMNGCSSEDSKYVNSTMSKPVTWAAYSAYPEMGGDTVHPSVGIDLLQPKVCYISSQYARGIMVNIWNGSKMMFSPTNLLCICEGGYLGTDRWGPQWTPTLDGGAYVAFCKGKRVKLRHVAVSGGVVSVGPVVDVCAGSRASMCTDRNGQIHLVYNQGGMRYRKVIVK